MKPYIRFIARQCVRCARFSTKPQHQLTGVLPAARVTPARPFQSTGVDYAGPINVRMSKGGGNKSYKGYICIFVCMSTKAVHIEIVSDCTTPAFIAAYKRFVSRRGHCAELYSDNGTYFHGANHELQGLLKNSLTSQELIAQLENDGTSWKFIPPGAPHFGGIWEAAVKSAKHHLRRIIGDSTMTYEKLRLLPLKLKPASILDRYLQLAATHAT